MTMTLHQIINIIFYKTYTDIRVEASRSYLGLIWWVIEPLMYLCAFYVLFVLIMQRGGPGFVPFFLCGAVVWKWFGGCIKSGANAVSLHRGLLQQVYVPKYIFPVITVLGNTVKFIPVLLLLLGFLWAYGMAPQATWLALPVVVLVQFCLMVALAMLVGSVVPFLPDLKSVIENGMMLLMFISGVFFDINEVHEPLKGYLLLNPMAGLIDEYRNVLMRGLWPDMARLGVILLVAAGISAVAAGLFRKFDSSYAKVQF